MDLEGLQERFARELKDAWQPDKISRENKGQAALLAALEQHTETLLAQDPWIPVPQSNCTFTFGDRSGAFPIGALVHLWKYWPSLYGDCPQCGKNRGVRGYSFGGLLTIGGISGVCLRCGGEFMRWIGGLQCSRSTVQPLLAETPFFLNRIIYGASVTAQRQPLYEALRRVADPEILPSPQWAATAVRSTVILRGAAPVIAKPR